MNKKALNAFYQSGRAIGLCEIGARADISLSGAPGMSPFQVAATIAGASFRVDLPPVKSEDDLMPVLCASEALQQAVKRGAVKSNQAALERIVGGAVIEASRHIMALKHISSSEIARERSTQVAERAAELVKWKWHSIKKLAAELRTRRSLSDCDVRSLIGV